MKKKMVCILMAGVMASLVPAQMVFAEGDSGEKTVVKFQTWNPGDEEYTHAMLEKFEEEHPDIQIDYTFMPYTDHVEKLKVDLSAGDAADVYGVQTGAMYKEFRDFEEDLTPYLVKEYGDDWASNYNEYAMSLLKGDDGEYYAVPLGLSYAGYVWANMKYFDKYGLELPTNYDELKEVCKTFRDNGEYPLVIGAKDSWINIDTWMNIAADINTEKLYSAIEKMEAALYDDRSKKIYREVVRRRIIGATGEYNKLKTRIDPQYLYQDMYKNVSGNEIIVDCGGYIGDSVEKFVLAFGNKVKKIYSFECFEDNILKIKEMGQTLKKEGWSGELVVASYAVSDKTDKIIFNDIGNPDSGYLPDSRLTVQYNEKLAPIKTIEVETRTIDGFIPEDEKVTLIKMDIEGAEYDALKGAEKTIKKDKPRLAISIYHNPSDYWRIYELIHEFSSEYKFAVRHHQNNHLDTVLYAWVED